MKNLYLLLLLTLGLGQDPDLVAHYPFNGSAHDESGNNNHLDEYGGVALTTDRFGQENQAYYFDGNDDYLRRENFDLTVDNFSLSMWVNSEEIPNWYKMAFAIHSGGGGSNKGDKNISIHVSNQAGLSDLTGVFTTTDGEEAHDDEVVRYPNLNSDQWYHVVLIKNGSSLSLFVDGEFSDEIVDNHGTYSITGGFLEVGAPNYWNGGWSQNGRAEAKWHGKIDDVRFYNIAITESEIEDLYCEFEWCANSVVYYPFNGDATDESGNGNDGDVNGATLTTDRFGNENSAYSFDGVDDYISIADNNSLDFDISQDFSLYAWIKLNTTDNTNDIIAKQDGTGAMDPGYRFGIVSEGNQYLHLQDNNSGTNYFGNSSLDVGAWAQVALVVDRESSNATLYLNGQNNGTVYYNETGSQGNSNILSIGTHYANSEGGESWFNGKIDDVRIYNRILDESVIQELFCEGGWCDSQLGCTNPDACNYDPEATEDDGSCQYLDICGVCEGDNSSCPTVTDIDGNFYSTIQIGTQNWMQQNLKATHYLNGDDVPFYDYENNASYSETYGRLYTWDAVDDERHVCLDGWHVPSDDEWKTLEVYLGMSQEESNNYGWRGNNEGDKLKEDGYEHWESGGSATNESGFTALPSGHYDNGYYDMGTGAYFWTRSGSGSEDTFIRHLSYDDSDIYRPDEDVSNRGMAIRCIETIEGCTDSYASNFNEEANVDDGSCAGYPDNGDFSLEFREDDYVALGGLTWGSLSNGTISGSFMLENFTTAGQILGEASYSGIGALGFLVNNSGGIWASVNNEADGMGCNFEFGAGTVSENGWYQFIMTWATTSWHFYLYDMNGQVVHNSLTGCASGTAYNPNIDQIGKSWDGNHWGGLIDNLALWNIYMDQTQVENSLGNNPSGNENELIGYWNFNAGSSDILYDHSGNQNHGTINGATWVENIYGCTDEYADNYDETANVDDGSCEYPDNGDYSLSFDGVDDYVALNPTFYGYQNEYSIAASFYANSYDGRLIYHNRNHDMSSYLRLTSNPNNGENVELNFYVGTDTEECPGYTTNSGYCAVDLYFPVNLNEWYNVVGSYDGEVMKLYVNGILVDSIEFSGNQYWYGDPLPGQQGYSYTRIGDNDGGGYIPIDGYIDNLSIWNRALLDEEILNLKFITLTGEEDGIKSLYNFNEGTGTTLADLSGNGNHGTIYGATWMENIYGCTDEYADNYDSLANMNDGSCEYPDNGDYSLQFDGNRVEVSSSTTLNSISNEISIYGRIKPNGFSGAHRRILNRGDCAGGSRYILVVNPEGKLEFGIGGGSTVISESVLTMNEWSEIFVIMEEGTAQLFINGNPEGESSIGNLAYNSEAPLYIGSECTTSYYQGLIDELIIWNVPISIEELPQDIQEGLVTHYKFNYGDDSILYDHSGNGNHGTIYGATWSEDVPCEACGCTNPDACNYDSEAEEDDGSCESLDECGECGGSGIADGACDCAGNVEDCASECGGSAVVDECGECNGDNSSCTGCTDQYADNYDETANVDDGSCAGYPDNGDYSLQFDGENDYVIIDNPSNMMIDTMITLEAWIKWSPTTPLHYQSIISKRLDDYDAYVLAISSSGKLVYFSDYPGGQYESEIELNANEWSHVAIVVESNVNINLFINGINVNTFTGGTIHSNNAPLSFGVNYYAFNDLGLTGIPAEWLYGNISQIRISNNKRYESNFLPNTTFSTDVNTVGYWNFNAGEDNILYDHSGNQNHGTINGATWSTDVACSECGCTNPDACDYDPDATEDDGSCQYLDECGVCGGSGYADNCGVCDDDPENDCPYDCAGVPGGDAVEDCAGICGGISEIDECGICGGDGAVFGDTECCEIDVDQCGVCGGDGSIPEGVCDCAGNLYNCNICPTLDPEDYGTGEVCDLNLGYGYDGESCSEFTGCGYNDDAELFFDTFDACDGSCQNCKTLDPDDYGTGGDDFGWGWTGNDCENIFGTGSPQDDSLWFYDSYEVCMTRCNYEGWFPWEDDPGAYEFIATVTAAVYINGMQFGDGGDELAAFDTEGNIRGVAVQLIPEFGPYEGEIVYEIQVRSNDDGDQITFQYYDISENAYHDICESYTFVNFDIVGSMVDPHILNCASFECWDGSLACSEAECPGIPNYPYDWVDDPDFYGAYEFPATMTAIVTDHDVQLSDSNDLLAAFDNEGNLRGLGVPLYVSFGPYEGTIVHEIGLWSNDAGDNLTFQFYDASEDAVLNLSESYTFEINDIVGSMVAPHALSVQYEIDLTIELIAGWNWISINVLPEDPSIGSVLADLGEDALFINSQEGAAQNYVEWGIWDGALAAFEPGDMYRLQMGAPATLVVTGTPVDVASTPIDLIAGWNWLGYLPQNPGAVGEAFTSLGADALFINSQGGAAQNYVEWGIWDGALQTLLPGGGYLLQMGAPATFTYPEFDGLVRLAENKQEVVLSSTIEDWDFHYGDYEFIGTISASIESHVDGDGDGDVVGVFVDGECRGISERMYFQLDDTYYYMIQVFSNEIDGEELTFKYYDKTNDEVIEYSETLTFENNMIVGDGFNTFGLSREVRPLPDNFNLDTAYPNPFNPTTTLSFAIPVDSEVSLSIYNLQGREVVSLINGNMEAGYHSVVWNADSHSSGLYFVKMLSGEYVNTQKLMLVK